MLINKTLGTAVKAAAVFIAALFLSCSAALFVLPAKTVSADIGQPEIPVPALSDVHCASYCVYDKTTGYIVLSMNPDDKIYPASMTKIMTCLLSLEILDTSSKVEVSKSALAGLGNDSSLMGVLEGEKVKVSELLYGLMLPSGNDAANALGEGCIDAFFQKYPAGGNTMNKDGVNAQYIHPPRRAGRSIAWSSFENGLNGFAAEMRSDSRPPQAGDPVRLVNEPLYTSARTRFPSGKANGTYYLYDGKAVNGRYRVTNKRANVGRKPAIWFVSGWIDASALE